jgi:hypothetical protein
MRRKPKKEPYQPCHRCSNGYVIVIRDNQQYASRCFCWLTRNLIPEQDGKSKAISQ